MTWEELLDKYAPDETESFYVDINEDTKVKCDFLGGVRFFNHGRFGITYFDIKGRTPEQMEMIINGMKGDRK